MDRPAGNRSTRSSVKTVTRNVTRRAWNTRRIKNPVIEALPRLRAAHRPPTPWCHEFIPSGQRFTGACHPPVPSRARHARATPGQGCAAPVEEHRCGDGDDRGPAAMPVICPPGMPPVMMVWIWAGAGGCAANGWVGLMTASLWSLLEGIVSAVASDGGLALDRTGSQETRGPAGELPPLARRPDAPACLVPVLGAC
jgi:hypothetical protein